MVQEVAHRPPNSNFNSAVTKKESQLGSKQPNLTTLNMEGARFAFIGQPDRPELFVLQLFFNDTTWCKAIRV